MNHLKLLTLEMAWTCTSSRKVLSVARVSPSPRAVAQSSREQARLGGTTLRRYLQSGTHFPSELGDCHTRV